MPEVFNLKVSSTRKMEIGKRTKVNVGPNLLFPGHYTDKWIKTMFLSKRKKINYINEKVCVWGGRPPRLYMCVDEKDLGGPSRNQYCGDQ